MYAYHYILSSTARRRIQVWIIDEQIYLPCISWDRCQRTEEKPEDKQLRAVTASPHRLDGAYGWYQIDIIANKQI